MKIIIYHPTNQAPSTLEQSLKTSKWHERWNLICLAPRAKRINMHSLASEVTKGRCPIYSRISKKTPNFKRNSELPHTNIKGSVAGWRGFKVEIRIQNSFIIKKAKWKRRTASPGSLTPMTLWPRTPKLSMIQSPIILLILARLLTLLRVDIHMVANCGGRKLWGRWMRGCPRGSCGGPGNGFLTTWLRRLRGLTAF